MSPVFISLFLLCAHLTGAAADYKANQIYLNCGGPPVSIDNYGQKWTTDIGSKFASPGGANSTTSPAANLNPAVPAIPYRTARMFRSPFTYTFPVSPGRVLLLLEFYLSSYAGLDISDARFTVTTPSHTLLNNFSAVEEAAAKGLSYNNEVIVKDFTLNVEGEKLSLTFTPASSSSSKDYYGFVNGIEVVSYSKTTAGGGGGGGNEPSPAPTPLSNSSRDHKKIGRKFGAVEIAFLVLSLVLHVHAP